MKQKAFTLIELLIVVAIIAILAAISVPNFLEAQTRSRVSRTLNDIRTLAVAIRSYEVDHNQAPPSPWFEPWLSLEYNWTWTVYYDRPPLGMNKFLTSPIAYTSATPIDIFAPTQSATAGAVIGMGYNWFYVGPGRMTRNGAALYELTISEMSCFNSAFIDKTPNRLYGSRPYRWSLFSPGPDRVWWPTNKGVIYDPTNGTISGGDIWYFDYVGFIGGTTGR